MSEPDDRIDLSVEDALDALDIRIETYDDGAERTVVHCVLPAANTLVGADWDLSDVRELFERDGAEVAGPRALSTFHGVGVRNVSGYEHPFEAYFATRKDWIPPTESTRERKP